MIKIVRATIEHAGLIAEIGKQSFLASHSASASKEDIDHFIRKSYTKERIAKELENAGVQYHIIYFNHAAVGFSKIEFNSSNENIAETAITKLDRLYLLKQYHGQNLGSKLFDFIVQLSKKQKQKGIWLAVWVENKRALGFYRKAGFNIVGEYSFRISETHSNPNHIMFLEYERYNN